MAGNQDSNKTGIFIRFFIQRQLSLNRTKRVWWFSCHNLAQLREAPETVKTVLLCNNRINADRLQPASDSRWGNFCSLYNRCPVVNGSVFGTCEPELFYLNLFDFIYWLGVNECLRRTQQMFNLNLRFADKDVEIDVKISKLRNFFTSFHGENFRVDDFSLPVTTRAAS